jgi:phosphomannomutase
MATANIKFGPSGWRAVIADKFTLTTLRRIAHAAAEHLRENREYGYKSEEYLLHLKNSGRAAAKLPHVVVGYDTRYFSREFGRNAAEAFAAEGLTVLLSDMETPTPAASWTVMKTFAAGGFMLTAGSEPAHYSGVSWIPYWGGPALPEVTDDLELRAQGLTIAESEKFIPYDQAVSSGVIKVVGFRESYLNQIYSLLDTGAIKKAGLKVAADSLHGAAGPYLRTALEKLGVKVIPLREDRDILFGGVQPDINEGNLKALRETVLKNRLNLGLACDGDASRYGIVDSDGTWIPPNLVLGLAVEHLAKNRGLRGRVARSLMTSHFTDAVASHHGLSMRETPVGFRHIGSLLRTGQYLIGGEEAGGLSIAGHVPAKDGILACLLMAEMVAYERKPLRQILAGLIKRTGNFVNTKMTVRADQGVNLAAVIERLTHRPPLNLAGASVWRIDHTDGFKFIMKDGSWLGLRPSTAEYSVGIYAEASTKARMDTLVAAGGKIINGKF